MLLGAGHAHLDVLRRTAEFTSRGFELVLVAPGAFWYSGLATGVLGGLYPPSLDQVDVGALVTIGGGTFFEEQATAINLEARFVTLHSGASVAYDVVSLNVGSDVPAEAIDGLAEHAFLVKPISNLWQLRRSLEDRFPEATAERPVRITIAGGGATACELAGNIRRLAEAHDASVEITILSTGVRLLEAFPTGAALRVERSLMSRHVQIVLRTKVVRVEPGAALTADGRRFEHDILVGAIGLRPSPLMRSAGLYTNPDGAMLVDEHLRSVNDPLVFGGGDCVALVGRDLPKIGVYAVREAPALFHNLIATLEGKPLHPYRPQRRYLLILNLGDGTGLATWGQFSWLGRFPFWLKDRIDRGFLNKFQRPVQQRS